ncbi:MAG: ATP synthase F1 subunit gamma [Gemmatimonadetes bacterium]|nr:ATP synthase F1 subunit gamma [Gemmatimonadota bacterium]
MATLRQLRTRVSSIGNIQKVTNAMQLVAAARMRQAQEDIMAARPYAEKLDSILRRLSGSVDTSQHPLLVPRDTSRVAVCVIAADRGLCGGFNSSVFRRASTDIGELEDVDTDVITVGRKARNYFGNRDYNVVNEHIDVFRELEFSIASSIAQDLANRFLKGEVDQVHLVYSEFRSVAVQVPVMQQLLPIVPEAATEEDQSTEFMFEPDPDRLLATLIPKQVNFQVWRALLESNAGEQAARMQAMDNATKNAGDLIEELTREVNKVRQTAITLELMDIIGGAEAVS